jgi:hypothetical protein
LVAHFSEASHPRNSQSWLRRSAETFSRRAISRYYVKDLAKIDWEISRYRRAQAAIIDNGLQLGLTNVLRPILLGTDILAADRPARDMAHGWAVDPEIRKDVLRILEEVRLGEWSMEGEAFRLRLNEIEQLDGMIAAKEARRDKLLRDMTLYNPSFARDLQKSSDRLLEVNAIPSIAPSETEILN